MQESYQETFDKPNTPPADNSGEATVDWAASEAQAARNAIMQVRLFPDLTVGLRKALGYGPHVDILQHLIFWFSPRHPKMQKRWTLYKTYKEWHDECGLTDRQVKKGRRVLRDLGLVTEKKGPHGRLHYRVEWVELAKTLNLYTEAVQIEDEFDEIFGPEEGTEGTNGISLDGNSVQTDEDFTLLRSPDEGISLDGNSVQASLDGNTDQASLDGNTVRPNTEEDTEENFIKTTLTERSGTRQNGTRSTLQNRENKESKEQEDPEELAKPEPTSPPKPEDDALLAEIREVLDPSSGRWWGAQYIASKPGQYAPEKVVDYLSGEEELPYGGRTAELEPVVRYVLWEASREKEDVA